MKQHRFLSLFIAIATLAGILAAAPTAEAASKSFKLYYSLKFNQTVSGFDQCGMMPMPIVYHGTLFSGGKLGPVPDYARLKNKAAPFVDAAAQSTTHHMVVLDVEGSWALLPTDSRAEMESKATDYYDLLHFLKGELKARRSAAKLGYFRVAPPEFHQSPSAQGQPKKPYEEAVAALKRVGDQSDVLFPQLYAWGEAAMFRRYAAGTVATARSNWPKKPVFPFLWMQYRTAWNAAAGRYDVELLPKGGFGMQLQAVKDAGADGAVIWGTLGNSQARLDWDRNADWWLETKAFLASQGADMSKCKL
ncbi:hypothetical protein [Geminicoccus roseus]|uniref:hypothetical protein n=1 Tax=Geminicoccus roseus TaxID=404900 RepID=UPI0004047A8C|nr:hypothetical protein [Geminicoccus roseus]